MSYRQEDFDPAVVLATLVEHGVQFVVMGGTAATIRGSDALTVDTDVTPARTEGNLERLAAALVDLRAKLRMPEGNLVQAPLDAAALRNYTTCATRTAEAGDLDLVFAPDGIDGGYETLARAAEPVTIAGHEVWIASAEHIEQSRAAAYRRTNQAKYARSNAALQLALDVATETQPPTEQSLEDAAERARRYREAHPPRGTSLPPAPEDRPSR